MFFARLRGVPEKDVKTVSYILARQNKTIDSLVQLKACLSETSTRSQALMTKGME